MLPTAKLTKRRKKAIAFREQKQDKRRESAQEGLEDEVDVSSLEDQVLVDATQGQQGPQVGAKVLFRERKAGTDVKARRVVAGTKGKRKAEEEEEGSGESDQPKRKRTRRSYGCPLDGVEQPLGVVGADKEAKQSRFILFLGNLKYTTTTEAIQKHFSLCDPPPAVRLLTPKPSSKSGSKSVTKSKGCAFLEFEHRGALQQGLRLHHSQLDGRQINVELTAGGGGKGAARMRKLRERNNELEGQRRKRQGPGTDTLAKGTQRFSATSGGEQISTHKRTWTVGDVEETRRGGRKHKSGSKRRRSSINDFRTGVNAIPVGEP